jgi:hypothetical protein
MGSSNWNELADGLDANPASPGRVLAVGLTAGEAGPPGNGTFVYGMRTISGTTGAFGLATAQAGFAPVSADPLLHLDHSVRGALKRGASPSPTGSAAFLYACLQASSVDGRAYLLGLSDGDPSHIVLRKGVLAEGVPNEPLGSLGVLRRSSAPVPIGEWVHLRLDVIISPTGDSLLKVFRSELGTPPSGNLVGAPVWQAIPGMAPVVDDPLGANTGSLPLIGGYMGFGARFSDAGRRAYFARLECIREAG